MAALAGRDHLGRPDRQHAALVADVSGDALDAVLCVLQARWTTRQPRWGLPEGVDPLEGCIVSA